MSAKPWPAKPAAVTNDLARSAENAKAIGAIRKLIIVLFALGLLAVLFGRNIVDYVASIDLCMFFILCALWNIATVQNRNSERIAELLEQQNKLLRELNSKQKPEPELESGKGIAPLRADSAYDKKTSDGRFVI